MKKYGDTLRSKSVGFLVIAACVLIVLALTLSLFVTTFNSFKTGISGAVNTQTGELSTQIVYNYENFIDGIIGTSNIIQTDIGNYDLALPYDRSRFSKYLGDIVHLRSSDIITISVYDNASLACLASSDAAERSRSAAGSDTWFSEAALDPTVHVFSGPAADYKVNVSKLIHQRNNTGDYVLRIEISFHSFIDLVQKSNLGAGGHVTIIDPAYEIVYTSLPDAASARDEIEFVRGLVLGSESARIGGHNMAVNVDTLSNTKWRICVFINIDKLTDIERGFLTTAAVISLIVLLAGVFLVLAAARLITSPMKRLELAMRNVEQSDYFKTEDLNIAAPKEVEALIHRFNRMMSKISELLGRVIAEQDAQRKSELKALQNQINPHFLYNTLDSILWQIEDGKNREAAEMVSALASLFRSGISNDSETVPVRREIEHAHSYLHIQNMRYAGSFDYSFDVEEAALDELTIKLVLQPLVENCIYHGLKNKIDHGHIVISARIEGEFLALRVADNGYGMRRETIDKLYASFTDGVASNSVGLKNIYQRVMIYYGGKAQMIIESELDEGTAVTVREPRARG